MKKDLRRAYELAIEQHDLDYYKQELKEFEANQREQEEAEEARRQEAEAAAAEKAAKAAAKAQATPAKKSTSKKSKAKVDENDDVDMPDADEEEEVPTAKKSSKKRKAEGTAEVSPACAKVTLDGKPVLTLHDGYRPRNARSRSRSPRSRLCLRPLPRQTAPHPLPKPLQSRSPPHPSQRPQTRQRRRRCLFPRNLSTLPRSVTLAKRYVFPPRCSPFRSYQC